jgi:hypothetical protein
MPDPWLWWRSADLARVLGCPEPSVVANWPGIVAALDRHGIYDRDVCLGVLPTIAIETASTLTPLHEYGTPADWAGYEGGAAYAGRGYIQITHLSNYRVAGAALGIDLVNNPDLALDPTHAADILAWFWATKGVPARAGGHFYTLVELCHEHDWEWVRRVVQGGTAGLDRLIAIASALDAYADPTGDTPMPTPPVYNADTPVIQQQHDWDCAEQSTLWGVTALGRHPSDDWMEQAMLSGGIESTALGLLVGDGSKLAAWITEQYSDGSPTLKASNAASVSFDDVRSVAGSTAVLLGGHNWGSAGHWAGVRGYDPASDSLLLANPATGYGGIPQTMSRQQFSQVAPCAMVVIRADGAAPVPAPAPTPAPVDELAALRAQLADKTRRLDGLVSELGYISGDVATACDRVAEAATAVANTLRSMKPPAA